MIARPGDPRKRRCAVPVGRRPLAAIFLLAVLGSRAYGLNYYVNLDPTLPRAGERVSVIVLLPGIKAEGARALPPTPPKGLSLESVAVTPTTVMPRGEDALFGTRVVFVFLAEAAGEYSLADLEVRLPQGSVPIRPVTIEVLPAQGAPSQTPYAWKSPERVLQWQCFAAELAPRVSDPPKVHMVSLPASRGLALESSGERTVVGIALEEGNLLLPPVSTAEGGTASDPRRLLVVPAPAEISGSRAVGAYSARLVPPEKSEMHVGETLTVRVEIRGRGNLPILDPPSFAVSVDGKPVAPPPPALPVSNVHVVPGAYEGMAGRELKVVLGESGTYSIQAEPFVFFDTSTGKVDVIRFPAVRVRAVPVPVPFESAAGEDLRIARLLESYASRPGALGAAASRALSGDEEAALGILEAENGPEHLFVRGLALLRSGAVPEALAALAKAERKRGFSPGLSTALALCEAEAGMGVRTRDSLPAPRILLAVSVVLVVFGGALAGIRGFLRGRTRTGFPGMPGIASALAVAAAISVLLWGMSVLERRTVYAVATKDEAYSVPSESGSRLSGAFRGRTGVVSSSPPGWILLKFRDGGSAWLRDGAYITY